MSSCVLMLLLAAGMRRTGRSWKTATSRAAAAARVGADQTVQRLAAGPAAAGAGRVDAQFGLSGRAGRVPLRKAESAQSRAASVRAHHRRRA